MTEGLHVCHVTTVPMSLMFLRGQSEYMARRGIHLSFVSSPGDELDAFGEEEHVNVHGVAMTRRITPWRDLRSLFELWSHFRSARPDIVHAQTPKGGLLGILAARLSGVPTRIYHVRGLPLTGAQGWKRSLLSATERVSCTFATRIFCNSASLREDLKTHGIVDPRRVEVLGPGSGQGVDTARFSPDRLTFADRERLRDELGIERDDFVVGYIGRLVTQKGIGELEEAWRRVQRAHAAAHLLLIGPFEQERDAVPAEIRARLLSAPNVHVLGQISDTVPYYGIMDLFVLPTYREGFPNVLLEAAAMGVPVVATRVTGCVDAVEDRVTGTLVPPRDASALADAIETYIGDSTRLHRHGDAARRNVSRFEREKVWESLVAAYLEEARV